MGPFEILRLQPPRGAQLVRWEEQFRSEFAGQIGRTGPTEIQGRSRVQPGAVTCDASWLHRAACLQCCSAGSAAAAARARAATTGTPTAIGLSLPSSRSHTSAAADDA
eukprot:COSAG01_NODE_55606_length_324_cov_0.462222_1_plen_107_part_11